MIFMWSKLEGFESNKPQKSSRRRKVGIVTLKIGVILLISIITAELGVMLVDAYSGSRSMVYATQDVAIVIFPVSLILIFIGLALILMPDGLTYDGIWIFNVGGFNR